MITQKRIRHDKQRAKAVRYIVFATKKGAKKVYQANETRNIPKTLEATVTGYENVSVFQEEEQSKPKAWRRINRFSNFLVIFKDNLATEKQISDTKSYKHFVHLFEK